MEGRGWVLGGGAWAIHGGALPCPVSLWLQPCSEVRRSNQDTQETI